MTPPDIQPARARTEPLPRAEKSALVQANRALLDQDLLQARLVFRSRPRALDLQLSNFCNMSCTMCYDGNNPPLERLDEELVERIAAEVLPAATMLTPFAGSEPLLLTWDLTKRLATTYDVELDIVTNAQFLDEAKFYELEPHVSSITFSIDSHLRDVYSVIRLRSRPQKVFPNLARAIELCRQHGIEPVANVVFMVENAPFVEGTVAFLAQLGCTTVRLLEFHTPPDSGPDRGYSDAMRHLSPEWVAWKIEQCRREAERHGIRLMLAARDRRVWDYRAANLELRAPRSGEGAVWDDLPRFFPGYCVQSVDRLKVHSDGSAYPCCVADGPRLRLGNLHEQTFDEVWNGPTAQDLRRAMLTLDLPELCRSCEFHLAYRPREFEHMPVVDWFFDDWAGGAIPRVPSDRCTLEVADPPHLHRTVDPPRFEWPAPGDAVSRYFLVLAAGGEWNEQNVVFELPGSATSFEIPAARWAALRANLGYWWTLLAIDDERPDRSLRTRTVRCLIRHEPIPRVAGSTLYG